MTRPLRVAIVAPSLAILGGQSVQAAQLLRDWSGDPDVEAWLVPVNPPPPRVVRALARRKYVRTVVTQASYWPLLWRELRRADIVHAFSASYTSFLLSPLPAILVGALRRRPVLLNYHSGEAPDHLARSRLAREVLARVAHLAVPSPFLRGVFARHGLAAEVIPNVVDRRRFAFRARTEPRPRFLSARNLEPMYNVACTLRAFRRIQAEVPEATLTVVGAGSERSRLEALTTALGLNGVTFAGRVPPEDMPRYYDAADIYLQSPDIDNMPLSVLEAFASGALVVSTNAGGVPAMLTDEVHGLLVPRGDDEAMAAAALRLLREPGLATRLADAASDAAEAYTWPRVRSRWLTAYRRLAPIAPAAQPVGRLEHG